MFIVIVDFAVILPILTGEGYNCYNLVGGWRLYESVIKERTVPEYICTEYK